MLKHRDRRATPARIESAPLRSRRPKGDDGGSNWSENALGSTLRVDAPRTPRAGCRMGSMPFPYRRTRIPRHADRFRPKAPAIPRCRRQEARMARSRARRRRDDAFSGSWRLSAIGQ